MKVRKIAGLIALMLAALTLLAGCGGLVVDEAPAPVRATAAPAEEASEWLVELVTAAPEEEAKTEEPAEEAQAGPVTEPQAIADYLFEYGKLPDNFLTKEEAQALGWDSSRNYVSDVAPGMSIGGDRFGNYEGRLPKVKGRKYFEADANYTGGKRNGERIVYSSDGHVWYTNDHYETFTELFPSDGQGSGGGK